MAKTSNKLSVFSEDGNKFAYCNSDGIIWIWDTASGILEQEYQPLEHLTASTSCLQFSPVVSKSKTRKKKMKNTENGLLALGTVAGTILLYSTTQRKAITELTHSTSSPIVDMAWQDFKTLYSLAQNKTLVQWDVSTSTKIREQTVKGDSALCLISKQRIVIASRSIQLLNSLNKEDFVVENSYTGHLSSVIQLLPIRVESEPPSQYFISAAVDDRFIYAWSSKQGLKDPVGSFMVGDAVTSVRVSMPKDSAITVCVTTKKGSLQVFKHTLNGSNTGSRKSTGELTIIQENKLSVPILSSFICNNVESSLVIVYGISNVFKFEKFSLCTLVGKQMLTRNITTKVMKKNAALVKTITPIITKDTTFLGPAHLSTVKEQDTKRKYDDRDGTSSLPMEERLKALALDKPTTHDPTAPPKADNMTQLLIQGLHSKDPKLLSSVLCQTDEEVVNKTVKRLPVQAVVPLLQQLQTCIVGKGHKNFSYIIWVRAVLYHHMSHISTISNRLELMQPFYSVCASRVSALPEVTQLHARLDLMLTHVATRHQDAKQNEVEPEALLIYQDESSEEEADMPEDFPGVSESEDNWEELSEAEVNGLSDEDSEIDMDGQEFSSIKRRLEDDDEVLLSEDDNNDDDDDDEEDDLSNKLPVDISDDND